MTRRGSPVRVIPTFRPDAVTDPSRADWLGNLEKLEAVSSTSTSTYDGFLAALAEQRHRFRALGAVATDHGHRTARSVALGRGDAVRLFDRLRSAEAGPADAELFRAHMLMEMARMSCDDGLVMQLHAGVVRNHDGSAWRRFGADIGADFPAAISYTEALQPLLEDLRIRPCVHLGRLHGRRDGIRTRAGPHGQLLPGVAPRVTLVVPRLARRHASMPVGRGGIGRVLQVRRLRRRHPGLLFHSRSP